MRFITTTGLATRFAETLGAAAASTTASTLISGWTDTGPLFDFSACFVIDFLDGSTFTIGFDGTFFVTFTLTTGFDLVFTPGLALDFTAMTHILSLIIETPSVSFITNSWILL